MLLRCFKVKYALKSYFKAFQKLISLLLLAARVVRGVAGCLPERICDSPVYADHLSPQTMFLEGSRRESSRGTMCITRRKQSVHSPSLERFLINAQGQQFKIPLSITETDTKC